MKINAQCHRILICILSLGLAFWFGRLTLQYQISLKVPELQQLGELNTKIPIVTITDIDNGRLLGTVNTLKIRLKSGSEVAVPDPDQHFELNIKDLGFAAQPDPRLKVPERAKFVASKNGKYFYELDEATAKRLSPLTRVFFTTEKEAQAAGYKRRSQ
jgi:hypothetical protein